MQQSRVEGLAGVRGVYEKMREAVRGVVVGKDGVVELALVSLFAGGHVLLTDIPGVGKTTLARAIASSVDAGFGRIQFTPDLLPSDITGTSIYDPRRARFEWISGPVFAPVLLADEINRATPRTQSAARSDGRGAGYGGRHLEAPAGAVLRGGDAEPAPLTSPASTTLSPASTRCGPATPTPG